MRNSWFLPCSGVLSRLLVGACLSIIVVMGMWLGMASGFSVAHADGGQANFALQPVYYDPAQPLTKSYFIFNGKPGLVVKSQVRVTNTGTAKGSVALYPVDATTGQTSGAVYLNQTDPRKDVGVWLALGESQLTLNAGQSQIVSFQMTIPGTVRPGQHLGGIVAENLAEASSSQSNSAIQIKVKTLTIIAVQVNLPGTVVDQLTATGIQAGGDNGYQQLLVGLHNTGDSMIKPSGTLQIANAQGKVLKQFSLKLDTFVPQTAINYPVIVTGQGLAAGIYQATLDLTYGQSPTLNLHYTTKFTITQQQLTQVFGNNSSKTQAPAGLGSDVAGMPLWQLLLTIGGGLAILWVAGSVVYRRVQVSRKKKAKPVTRLSQFKKPF